MVRETLMSALRWWARSVGLQSTFLDVHDVATTIRSYNGFQSIATLPACSFTGLLCFQFGTSVTLIVKAGQAQLPITSFFVLRRIYLSDLYHNILRQ